MKERRAAGRSGDLAEELDLDRERALRRKSLWEAALAGASSHDPRVKKLLAGLADWDEVKKHRTEQPCKVTLVERELALAGLSPSMTPQAALTYASWLMAHERGWGLAPVPEGPAADASLEHTPQPSASLRPAGALASGLGFIAPSPTAPGLSARPAPVAAAPARLAARLRPGAHAPDAAESPELLDEVLALARTDGPGEPLPADVLAAEKERLGELAARVRVHTGAAANLAAQRLGASAFTVGHDIYFAAGEYAPGTAAGDRLLRHELTHVGQNDRGGISGLSRPELLDPSSTEEAEAAAAETVEWAGVRLPAHAQRRRADGTQPGVDEAEPEAAPASLRAQLLDAATTGRGAGETLDAAEPTAAASALRELRGTPVPGESATALQLLTRRAGPQVGRLLGQSSRGRALSADLVAKLAPHVGPGAAGAARLHTDESADLLAAAHHARAVTVGEGVYFAHGQFAPGTAPGDELLVHELTHVAQGQRGDLHRAAAKGLTSGDTLDPAEAEADLRAKLAVVELHAPAAAEPTLAQPSGQPTSDGDRAAKISAQKQRLRAAEKDDIPNEPVKPPASVRPDAPQAHAAPPMEKPATPGSSDNAYAQVFDAPPSKQAMELWAGAGAKATTAAKAEEAAFEAGLKPLPVLLDGKPAPAKPGAGGPGHTPKQAPAKGATPPAAKPSPTPAAKPVTAASDAAAKLNNPDATPESAKAEGKKLIQSLPTSSPEVDTNPGPAPVTDLAGQADPMRATIDQHHAATEGVKAVEAAKQKILKGPGAAAIQPAKLDEKLDIPKPKALGEMPALPEVPDMAKFKKWNLPGDVQASFDDIAKPKMDASLSEAKAKMSEAEKKRDEDRAKAVDDAQEKVKQAHADADKQQQAKVAESRTQIANHQAATLLKHDAEFQKLDKQSDEKKKATLAKVNARVEKDQAKVEADFKDAQKKADDKKAEGEKDAEKKKREAEEKAKDDSWWGSITSAICDAIEAIADEIDKALEAIGKAICDLIDTVKKAACDLIDAARDFLCEALSEFGDWLKSAVTALLGSVFPELAAELNRLIDAAVNAAKDAVNAIADGLKTAVTALCDGLKASVEAAIAAFRAAVQAAATLAKALVTGDWKLVAKMVLEGILKLLGIDPGAFYALIGKAEDSITKIIDDPGAFVGHLIDAVKLGFQQFGDNFLTHLKDGVVQWLFGTFAEAGIQMPASFDVAGVFSLVAQVLGLTWPRLRVKVVKIIGEENTERLEFVAQYIEPLMTGGFAGLWEKIQQDMSTLWDTVIGGAKQWLMEKLIQQAIIKIATMWNPAGAIIQLIQTAWNVYCWVKENAQRIFGLVNAVVDSISNIVAGNISGAANYIEASLAKLVPIAISLFANLLGLGGIADKIKSIIEKIQTKVDQAIDKLIERVKGMFKGKGGKGGKGADGEGKDGEGKDGEGEQDPNKPVGGRITFQVHGETHTQYIDKGVPMVASTPTGVKAKIEEWRPRLRELPEADKKRAGQLIGKAIAIEGKVADLATKVKAGTAKEPDLEAKQRELADTLAQLWEVMAPDLDPNKPFAEQDPRATLKSPQYAQFKSRFLKLAADLDMPGGDAKAQEIWLEVVTTLQKTDEAYKAAPNAPNTNRKDLAADGFKKIMAEFDPITAALKPYMDKFAQGKKSWAFWSGKPAVEVAKKHSEVCLEKSALGALFDNINISGSWDIQMWASLSKAYAHHAASHVGSAKYSGFVGMGSSAEQSIFNKIEQPHFASMLSEKQKVDLHIDWYAAAGDPKTGMAQPDWRFKAASLDGVYAKGDRGAMVDKAESENKRRLDLYKEKGIDEGPDGEGKGGDASAVEPFAMGGESHTLTVTKTDNGVKVIMASTPEELAAKITRAVELCTAETARLNAEKKATKQNEKDKINALGEALTRIKNIKAALGRLQTKHQTGLETAKDLDDAGAKRFAMDLANDLIEIGRKYDIRSIGDQDMDLRSKQALGMPGHQHDRFIYAILTELGGEVVNEGNAKLAAPEDDQVKASFERIVAEARAGYGGAANRAEGGQFTFRGRPFVVEKQAMKGGGSANYVFPASKAGTGDAAYKDYGYPKFAWTVQTIRDIASQLIDNQKVGDDDLTMFIAALAAEPHRNVVAEVTNLLVLGPSTPGTNQAFKANKGDMPMTVGGTIKDPHDSSLDDLRQGSGTSSGAVTDQEVQIAKDYYKKHTGADLEAVITERGESPATKAHVKSVLREQFHR